MADIYIFVFYDLYFIWSLVWNVVEEEIYDSTLSHACIALFIGALFEGCIYFII